MRLLHRLGHDVAQGDVEILAMVFAAALPEHRKDCSYRLLEHFLLGFHIAAERRQFGNRGALTHSELDAAIAQEVEYRNALGNACGMVGGKLEDAMAKPDLAGALAGGGEKGFRRGGGGVFFQKKMLPPPGVVVAKPVGGFQLRERVLVKLEFVAGVPWPRQLQLIEDAEFHDVSPSPACCLQSIHVPGRVQRRPNSAPAKAACARRTNG